MRRRRFAWLALAVVALSGLTTPISRAQFPIFSYPPTPSAAGTIGGSSGATDDRLVSSDGAGGSTIQATDINAIGSGSSGKADTLVVEGMLVYADANLSNDEKAQIGATILFGADVPLRWYNDADISSGSADVGLERSAAGQLEVTNGSTGQGVVVVKATRDTPQASPPVTCGDANTLGYEYTDTSLAKCFCDGTAWQVLNPSTVGVGTCA